MLAPRNLKLDLTRTKPARTAAMARYVGCVVGQAYGRQLDDTERASWRKTVMKGGSEALDAPSWLWSSVVKLFSLHEAAYVDY